MLKIIFLFIGFVLFLNYSNCARIPRDAEQNDMQPTTESNLEALKKYVEELADSAKEMFSEAGTKIKENVNREKFEELLTKAKDSIARLTHSSPTE